MKASEALGLLRARGFRCTFLEYGTIWANRGGGYYGFRPKFVEGQPRYNEDAIKHAIKGNIEDDLARVAQWDRTR